MAVFYFYYVLDRAPALCYPRGIREEHDMTETVWAKYIAANLHRDLALGCPSNLNRIYQTFEANLRRNDDQSVTVISPEAEYTYADAQRSPFYEAQVIGRAFLELHSPDLSGDQVASLEEFALELLMPEWNFRQTCWTKGEGGDLNLAAVAEHYGVSKELVAKNAINLGVI